MSSSGVDCGCFLCIRLHSLNVWKHAYLSRVFCKYCTLVHRNIVYFMLFIVEYGKFRRNSFYLFSSLSLTVAIWMHPLPLTFSLPCIFFMLPCDCVVVMLPRIFIYVGNSSIWENNNFIFGSKIIHVDGEASERWIDFTSILCAHCSLDPPVSIFVNKREKKKPHINMHQLIRYIFQFYWRIQFGILCL